MKKLLVLLMILISFNCFAKEIAVHFQYDNRIDWADRINKWIDKGWKVKSMVGIPKYQGQIIVVFTTEGGE